MNAALAWCVLLPPLEPRVPTLVGAGNTIEVLATQTSTVGGPEHRTTHPRSMRQPYWWHRLCAWKASGDVCVGKLNNKTQDMFFHPKYVLLLNMTTGHPDGPLIELKGEA